MADVHRPLLSEGAITGPPYNHQVIKEGVYAWILDPTKNEKDSIWIVCLCTKEEDNLYHIHNPTNLLAYRQPLTVSLGLINLTPSIHVKGNRQITHN